MSNNFEKHYDTLMKFYTEKTDITIMLNDGSEKGKYETLLNSFELFAGYKFDDSQFKTIDSKAEAMVSILSKQLSSNKTYKAANIAELNRKADLILKFYDEALGIEVKGDDGGIEKRYATLKSAFLMVEDYPFDGSKFSTMDAKLEGLAKTLSNVTGDKLDLSKKKTESIVLKSQDNAELNRKADAILKFYQKVLGYEVKGGSNGIENKFAYLKSYFSWLEGIPFDDSKYSTMDAKLEGLAKTLSDVTGDKLDLSRQDKESLNEKTNRDTSLLDKKSGTLYSFYKDTMGITMPKNEGSLEEKYEMLKGAFKKTAGFEFDDSKYSTLNDKLEGMAKTISKITGEKIELSYSKTNSFNSSYPDFRKLHFAQSEVKTSDSLYDLTGSRQSNPLLTTKV